MRKPVKRAIRLEEVLGDLIGTEETLLRLQMDNAFDALTEKQIRLYKEVLAKLSELVQDLSNDVATRTPRRLRIAAGYPVTSAS